MISEQNIAGLLGGTVTDTNGHKIGTVGQVFVDPDTGRPNWATVVTGFFGTSESFVPLDRANTTPDGDLQVPCSKDEVKDAPRIDTDTDLSDAEEDRLYEYYQLTPPPTPSSNPSGDYGRDSATRVGDEDAAAAGHDTSGPTTDDAMTRSEEQLR